MTTQTISTPLHRRLLAALKTFAVENSILMFLIVIFIAASLFLPNFFRPFNLSNLLLQTTDIMIIAVGMTFVVLNGGIDFSCTSVLALGSVFGAYIMVLSPLAGLPVAIPVAIGVMLLIGALVGSINGFSVVILRMPSFIVTLATMMIGSGIAIWFNSLVASRSSIYGLPGEFVVIGGDTALWLPVSITVAVILFAHWLLKYTLFGRQVFAVGTNPRAAFISGIPVKRTIFMLMLISGLCAGLQSIVSTARIQAGVPTLGERVFIDIIAAIIIGGTSIFGGSGGVKQTVYGVLFITMLNNIVNLMGIEWYVISLIKGVLVLVAALVDIFTRRLELLRL